MMRGADDLAYAAASKRARRPRTPVSGSALMAVALCLMAVLTGVSSTAHAHPMSPGHVRIMFTADGTASDVTLTHAKDSVEPQLLPPAGCRIEPREITANGEERVISARWHCAPGGVMRLVATAGSPPLIVEIGEIGKAGVEGAPGAYLLDHASPALAYAPATTSAWAVVADWVGHGAHHLLIGADHVLLVLGLVLLLGLGRRLVAAVTAFTLGHSLSLALGATGVVVLPAALVESAIAATLVWLALDLVHASPSSPHGPIARRPWLVGAGIGLVHGLGFAGVLADLGLPDQHATLALAGFNIGLELAQLGLVVAFGALLWVGRRISHGWSTKWQTFPVRIIAHAVGIIAAAWFFERAVGG